MLKKKIVFILFLLMEGFIFGCGGSGHDTPTSLKDKEAEISKKYVSANFNVDSAFLYTKEQVNFGPRIPGTQAHEKCAQYLIAKLKGFGMTSYFQEGNQKVYTGATFPFKNIIGSYRPENPERILLSAHWDTRPFSDEELDKKLKNKPFQGANDAASGVGILLEIARQLSINHPNLGVDFIFWDIEDYGMKNDTEDDKTWCLGTRYWIDHPPVKGYNPLYNINLDMVGGVGAVFNEEKNSMDSDPKLVQNLWNLAHQLGYSDYFAYNPLSGGIIDDNVVVAKSGIPAIDIIDLSDTGFYKYWHKQGDNLDHLDKKVMRAVGHTLLENLYQEAEKNEFSAEKK